MKNLFLIFTLLLSTNSTWSQSNKVYLSCGLTNAGVHYTVLLDPYSDVVSPVYLEFKDNFFNYESLSVNKSENKRNLVEKKCVTDGYFTDYSQTYSQKLEISYGDNGDVLAGDFECEYSVTRPFYDPSENCKVW